MTMKGPLASADLDGLVVLRELLRARSATGAARRLGRAQSSVSHALGRLRQLFDDPLLVRVGNRLEPTPFAEGLVPDLDAALGAVEALFTSKKRFEAAKLRREFVLAGTDFSEWLLLPSLTARLRREAPGVEVRCRALGGDIERSLQEREVDVAFGTLFRERSGLVTKSIAPDELVTLLRSGHPAAGRLDLGRYTALDHVLVTPRGNPGSPVDAALTRLGLSRRVVLRVMHFSAAAAVVAQSDLAVTLPASFARVMARTLPLVLRPLPVEVAPFHFGIAWGAPLTGDPAHRYFRGLVEQAARLALGPPRAQASSSVDSSASATRSRRARARASPAKTA